MGRLLCRRKVACGMHAAERFRHRVTGYGVAALMRGAVGGTVLTLKSHRSAAARRRFLGRLMVDLHPRCTRRTRSTVIASAIPENSLPLISPLARYVTDPQTIASPKHRTQCLAHGGPPGRQFGLVLHHHAKPQGRPSGAATPETVCAPVAAAQGA